MFFNERLLQSVHVNWHSTCCLPEGWWHERAVEDAQFILKQYFTEEFVTDAPLRLKDPRQCILLPVYLEVFKDLGIYPFFLMTFREPVEIIASLGKRAGFPAAKSLSILMKELMSGTMELAPDLKTLINGKGTVNLIRRRGAEIGSSLKVQIS